MLAARSASRQRRDLTSQTNIKKIAPQVGEARGAVYGGGMDGVTLNAGA